jgi:V8-like Glu-specific endopeptidase
MRLLRSCATVTVVAGLLAFHSTPAGAAIPLAPLPEDFLGSATVTSRIFNGTPTSAFPAVVEIYIYNSDSSIALCSGTLIGPLAVLTAGHCLSFGAVGADVFVFPDGVTPIRHRAVDATVHPNFSIQQAAYADVALLALETPVTETTPIPLIPRSPRAGLRGTIVGFGLDGGAGAETKRMGTVRIRRCPRAIRRVGIFPGQLSTSVCWKPKANGNDTCPGDSGGPLLVKGALAGVTSGGYGVASCPGLLSWDTSVAKVRDFIDAALAQPGYH